jgi:excisionase family DNA binding protein
MTADLLTTGAIAARWDCSKRTVEDLCRSKALRAVKLAGHWRVSPEDLAEYEGRQENRPPARRRRRRTA